MRKVLEIDNNEIRKKKETIKMAKVKTFKTIFPAVSVPLNDDYSTQSTSQNSEHI